MKNLISFCFVLLFTGQTLTAQSTFNRVYYKPDQWGQLAASSMAKTFDGSFVIAGNFNYTNFIFYRNVSLRKKQQFGFTLHKSG
ncbi:MAG TPA: hypothetical protein ENH02_05050 [Bacteroidetes bacterium]|nr:hypothetical protein [Bacteroidota bacterium]